MQFYTSRYSFHLSRASAVQVVCGVGVASECVPDMSRTAALHTQTSVSLIAQDMALFQQLFALQEAILELKEQLEYCPSSNESSPYDSPCSTLSSLSSSESVSKCTKRSASFVRQQVSYPPIARNRSRRIKAYSPQHGCQDSYDSGIHTSDHEIFV
ncbi:uncharacterized protein [Periplaneta americana]|uniref:uncharacterized protein isoform X2 n=1 Tax=Periplaneta americana TaxID=6978 RepID=UPI0037E784A3